MNPWLDLAQVAFAWFESVEARLDVQDSDHPFMTRNHGIAVVSGQDLQPALAMLPFAERLTLLGPDAGYLSRQIESFDDSWEPFWRVASRYVKERDIRWARRRLSEVATVHEGSILDLPFATYDAGLLAVDASNEDFSSDSATATAAFLAALKPDATFVATYAAPGYAEGGILPLTDRGRRAVEKSVNDQVKAAFEQRTEFAIVRHCCVTGPPAEAGEMTCVVVNGVVAG